MRRVSTESVSVRMGSRIHSRGKVIKLPLRISTFLLLGIIALPFVINCGLVTDTTSDAGLQASHAIGLWSTLVEGSEAGKDTEKTH